jgi:hypothetical protein
VTAAQVAELLGARRTGAGKWMARCPVHDDQHPSLSISTGDDGRTLLHCFAGCSLADILAAIGLRTSDLFAWAPPSPVEMRRLAAQRDKRVRAEVAQRTVYRSCCSVVRRSEALAAALFAKAARMPEGPEGDKAAELAGDALRLSRIVEGELEGMEPGGLDEWCRSRSILA